MLIQQSDISAVIAENNRRKERLARLAAYNTDTSGPIDVERIKHDFEYWAARAVVIRDKRSGKNIPFVLNRAQRHVLEQMEQMRVNGLPVRIIILKARQWGASTLVLAYMAWLQLVLYENWHSVICAHVKDSARNIRAMYSTLLDNYPTQLTEDGKKMQFKPFEGAQNVRFIKGPDCRVAITSAECQDAIRGADIAMAHLSEVAYWKASQSHDPEDTLRAIASSVSLEPGTVVVIESTANGVGNFFHTEWLRAEKGLSDKKAIFIPWYMNDLYALPVVNAEEFWKSLSSYELDLWHREGCSLEQINWYRHKAQEYPKAELMHAEFPTTPAEAFVCSDSNVFANDHIEELRAQCMLSRKGELAADRFVETPNGCLSMWREPAPGKQYVAVVDVGGRSRNADWSVIAVMSADTRPEVVAQWRGHIDHDLLADKAIKIARRYNDALLVIESNSLETADESSVSASVLEWVYNTYPYTYVRPRDFKGVRPSPGIGFHANRHSKTIALDLLIAAVRDNTYIERDAMACDELATYCRQPNGSYAARRGFHDDILMTRAIALYVMNDLSIGPYAAPESNEPFPPVPPTW
ncbi:MAG: hypothetical protein J1F20_05000 [Muribaculaceae bacterium]|nr:hypothetical protein [Muribaculaceae bacterium]